MDAVWRGARIARWRGPMPGLDRQGWPSGVAPGIPPRVHVISIPPATGPVIVTICTSCRPPGSDLAAAPGRALYEMTVRAADGPPVRFAPPSASASASASVPPRSRQRGATPSSLVTSTPASMPPILSLWRKPAQPAPTVLLHGGTGRRPYAAASSPACPRRTGRPRTAARQPEPMRSTFPFHTPLSHRRH